MTKQDVIARGKGRGITVTAESGRVEWTGEATGTKKPSGPLSGKRCGLLVAPEFSDFQAYYLAEYLSEYGADVQFIAASGSFWKYTRPTDPTKGVQGMWGMSLNPIRVLGESRSSYVELAEAKPGDYDVVVTLGGHSADILTTTPEALDFLEKADEAGATLAAIGEGTLPLVFRDLIRGRRCTGNRVVSYLLERVGAFEDAPVVYDDRGDGRLLTARNTEDAPAFVRDLCRTIHGGSDGASDDGYEGALAGRRITVVAGEDFEDIELVVPVLELLYRGAELTLATFPPPKRARPPMLGVEAVMGNFGVSVPLQDIPGARYTIRELAGIAPDELDLVMIPGAFCPWNMVEAGTPVEWLKEIAAAGKLIAAICHGAIPLSAADLVSGRQIAGVGACRDHVRIMGGTFRPEASAIVDGRVVTGRVPPDVPEFLDAITWALSD